MRKRWICLFTALMLLAGICGFRPMTSGAAPSAPVDLSKKCSITVIPVDLTIPEKAEYWEDMQTAHIVLELYKVAGAEKLAGYDTYTFQPEAPYGSLKISEYSDLQKLKAEDWEELAQEAAQIALEGSGTPLEPLREPEPVQGDGTTLGDLDAGLYLVVARDGDLDRAACVKRIQQQVTEENLPEGEPAQTAERLVTIANSARYEYAFTPQLIALPAKGEYEGEINTANPRPWVYGAEIYLKSGRAPRYGALEIIKTLRSYETVEGIIEPVTFVFRVVGRLDGEVVYNEVDSITFTEEGSSRTRLEGIPATAEVTVTEEYSGLSYTQTIPPNNGSVSDVIVADEVIEARFENVYDNHRTHGHGIKNQFVYNGEDQEWNWNADPEQESGSGQEQGGGQEAE